MKRITITIPEDLAEKLRSEAKKDDRPMSSIMRKAMTIYFARKVVANPMKIVAIATSLLLTGCQNWRQTREIERVLGLPIKPEYQIR